MVIFLFVFKTTPEKTNKTIKLHQRHSHVKNKFNSKAQQSKQAQGFKNQLSSHYGNSHTNYRLPKNEDGMRWIFFNKYLRNEIYLLDLKGYIFVCFYNNQTKPKITI